MFLYKDDRNKDFKHKITIPYDFGVTILTDRGFKSVNLFKFIDKTLKFKYYIMAISPLPLLGSISNFIIG